MTGGVKPDLNSSLMKADQLHPAIEFAQTRSYRVEGPHDTGFEIVGMQRIEKKQVADDRVMAETIDDSPALPPLLIDRPAP